MVREDLGQSAMNRKLFGAFFAACSSFLFWGFVGIERIVADHEMGIIWEPFIKHRASRIASSSLCRPVPSRSRDCAIRKSRQRKAEAIH